MPIKIRPTRFKIQQSLAQPIGTRDSCPLLHIWLLLMLALNQRKAHLAPLPTIYCIILFCSHSSRYHSGWSRNFHIYGWHLWRLLLHLWHWRPHTSLLFQVQLVALFVSVRFIYCFALLLNLILLLFFFKELATFVFEKFYLCMVHWQIYQKLSIKSESSSGFF